MVLNFLILRLQISKFHFIRVHQNKTISKTLSHQQFLLPPVTN